MFGCNLNIADGCCNNSTNHYAGGQIVAKLTDGGLAHLSGGLLPGDVITHINDTDVQKSSKAQVFAFLAKDPSCQANVTFRFNRAVISEATSATSAAGGGVDGDGAVDDDGNDEPEEKEVEVDTSPGSKIGLQLEIDPGT